MSSGPTFQLFPPPQKKPKVQIGLRIPTNPTAPEPALLAEADVERMELAKSPVNLHELIVGVNTTPSPEAVELPAHAFTPVEAPKRSLRRFNSVSTKSLRSKASSGFTRSTSATPPLSEVPSLHSATGTTPSATPQLHRAISPAFSDVRSARSGSPTLVRSNSTVTGRPVVSPEPEIPMQSIFPQYDHNKRLSQQYYRPMHISPQPSVNLGRAAYSPKLYTPYSDVFQEEEPPSACCPEPFFTPTSQLPHLWEAANGSFHPASARVFTLKMHQQQSTTDLKSSVQTTHYTFGPRSNQPFYTLVLTSTNLSPNPDVDHDLLLLRHQPLEQTPLPTAHLTLRPPPPAAPYPPPIPNSDLDSASLITTIYPKLAALGALEIAAQSPRASTIALYDPEAQSPAAAQLAQDAMQEAAARECSALVWVPTSSPSGGWNKTGRYELRHPSFGPLSVEVEGDVAAAMATGAEAHIKGKGRAAKPASIKLINPFAMRPDSKMDGCGNSPDLDDVPDSPSDMLASFDFPSGALSIDVGGLSALGNPYMLDAAVAAVLAVAVAECKRVQAPEVVFEGPPTRAARGGKSKKSNPSPEGKSTKKHKRWWRSKNGKKEKETARAGTGEIDLEAQSPNASKFDGSFELPWLARGVVQMAEFGIKAFIWIIGLFVKILWGIVAGTTKCMSKT